jgi:RNA polymerase sigma factor (sigma-70 family)
MLPRLTHLEPRNGQYTPVLLKFLSTTLINKINNLFQKHNFNKPARQHAPQGDTRGDAPDTVAQLPESLTGIVTRLARREMQETVMESLEKLDDQDRELIILRGIEQPPYQQIASIVQAEPTTLAVRYKRALDKLRKALPGSVYDEFVEE